MINKIILDTFKTDTVNWFKEHDYSINSLCADPYRGQISFIACYHGNKNVPTKEIFKALYTLNFNRSNHYGIRLPNLYLIADKRIEKPCRTSNFYEVLYSNISIYEKTPFMFKDIDIHFKPYFINECAYAFEQFLLWDYHKGPSIESIDNKNNLLTFVIDSDLEPITKYFTVTNLPCAQNLEFTFKRIDKIEHHRDPSNLRCTYQLVNVRTTIFDTTSSDINRKAEYLCKKLTDEEEDIRNILSEPKSSTDPVNHPNHYEMVGPFESFDIIVESLGIENARYFCQGNIIKYQVRYREKNGEEDLKKRHWYDRMDQMLAKCKDIEDYYKLKESDF